MTARGIQCYQTVKYGREPRGTQNQDSLKKPGCFVLQYTGTGWDSEITFCEQGNDHSGPLNGEEFPNQLSHY